MRWGLLFALLLACGDDDGSTDASTDTSEDAGADTAEDTSTDADPPIDLDCDPLVPTSCVLPFPSTFYEAADATMATGRRIEFKPNSLPPSIRRVRPDPAALSSADGWSTGIAIMAHFPEASVTGLPRPNSIARSLEPDSPTVVLDEEGNRVPHFAEIDASTGNEDSRAFIIRPVLPLEHDARYRVAIRSLVDSAGTPLTPSPAFQALRDGGDHAHPSVEARRAGYESLFAELETEGVERDSLLLAWEFHTRSLENATGDMLHMRDESFAALGPSGTPTYRIESVEEDVDEEIRVRIEGQIEVPLYLSMPGPGGTLTRNGAGVPMSATTAEFPFLVLVPHSATPDDPAAITQFGHGLFGTRDQATGHSTFANNYNHVLFAMDWIGMSADDVEFVADLINQEEPERFAAVADRLRQGMLNKLLAARMMLALADDPAMMTDGRAIVDTTQRYYFGESQGGGFGATYMALSTEVTRGGLRVPGQPYSLLLPRSVDFEPYFLLLRFHYTDGIDIQVLLALAQMFWDVVEPGTYSRFVRDPLPGTPPHEVLLHVAMGDHQVHELGSHHMARAIGAQNFTPAPRSIWGLDEVSDGHEGSALVEFDFGLPPPPIENVPPTAGEDPHGKIKQLDAAQRQLDAFFRTGRVIAACMDTCDPE